MSKNELAFDSGSVEMDDSAPARRRRAVRNKERLLNHQYKLLDLFADNVMRGYSDENWANVTKLYGQIADFLAPVERETLGSYWRDAYTGDCDPTGLYDTVNTVKGRLDKVFSPKKF